MGREVQTAQLEAAKSTCNGTNTNTIFLKQNISNGGLGQRGVRETEKKGRHNSLNFLCLNARSIKNKFLELEAIIKTGGYDIVGITETWLGDEDGEEYNIEGYNLIRKDRSSKRGGGVAVYVKENLNVQEVPQSDQCMSSEDIWIKVIGEHEEGLNIGVCYRPPAADSSVNTMLIKNIRQACQAGETIIMGDFNYPNINWKLVTGQGKSEEEFLDVVNDLFLAQHVSQPTRGKSVLDLVLCNNSDRICNIEVMEPLGTSDHSMISFDVFWQIKRASSNSRIFNFRRANFKKMRAYLSNINWAQLLDCRTVNEKWGRFKEVILDAQCRFIPKVRKSKLKKRSPQWINKAIRKSLREKKMLYKIYKKDSTECNRAAYCKMRAKVKRELRLAKRLFERQLAEDAKCNPKRFFQYCSRKRKVKEEVKCIKSNDGALLYENKDIADALNGYFVKSFTGEEVTDRPVGIFSTQNVLADIEIGDKEVFDELHKLKTNKSAGPDGIFPRVLKELSEIIYKPLARIFRQSLKTGEIPEDWKQGNIIPIYKKGDRTDPGNYRPVSLTCITCKIMESIIRNKLQSFIENNNILRDSQHGFCKGRSCLTNLLAFFEEATKCFDVSRAYDIIYLDFQKAFDKVPHGKLIFKMRSVGITGSISDWVQNWLRDRTQRVVVGGVCSEQGIVGSGVPQGSVLGPLLFLIYINDLDRDIESTLVKFADDTKLGGLANSLESTKVIQEDLNRIQKWSETWQMKFNITKCKVLHVGNKNVRQDYFMGGTKLECAQVEKDLGVIVDQSLSSSSQCAAAVKKANRMLGYIAKSIEYKSKDVILSLYNTFVRPHLEYCVQFWGPYHKKDIEALEKVQRRATRLIPCIKDKSYEERLKMLNLFKLSKRRLRGDLIETFKFLKGINKVNYRRFFRVSSIGRTRGHKWKLAKDKFRTDIRKYFFTQRVVNVWNSLPGHVVEAETLGIFKSRLDTVLDNISW